jgi:hypothetical protein
MLDDPTQYLEGGGKWYQQIEQQPYGINLQYIWCVSPAL